MQYIYALDDISMTVMIRMFDSEGIDSNSSSKQRGCTDRKFRDLMITSRLISWQAGRLD